MKSVILHDWLLSDGGAEVVLRQLAAIASPTEVIAAFGNWSDLDGVPVRYLTSQQRYLLAKRLGLERPAACLAFHSAKLPIAEDHLVLSDGHTGVLWARVPPDALWVHYCHTPSRFLWRPKQLKPSRAQSAVWKLISPAMRRVDRTKARRPDLILSNSLATAREVTRTYGVPSLVVYPPVRTDYFTPNNSVKRMPFALVVGRIENYRGYDRVITACESLNLPLKIVGHGSALHAMTSSYSSPTIQFLGRVSNEELLELYRTTSMVVIPKEEDFCIVAVEAMATGTPVVALGSGGVIETVIDGETGVLFPTSEAGEIASAIERAMQAIWDPEKIRARAMLFDEEAFRSGVIAAIRSLRSPADTFLANHSPGLESIQTNPTTV